MRPLRRPRWPSDVFLSSLLALSLPPAGPLDRIDLVMDEPPFLDQTICHRLEAVMEIPTKTPRDNAVQADPLHFRLSEVAFCIFCA